MSVYYQDESVALHLGDSLDVARTLPDESVDCIVTSPPYFGLRDYGADGQYGAEASPAEYVEKMRALFAELRRVLSDDGTLWLNLGDSYVSKPAGVKGVSSSSGLNGARTSSRYRQTLEAGHGTKRDTTGMGLPEKNLMGIPWRVAFALQDDGWILRNDIIWSKPNAMPESIRDRLSTRHEHVFMFSKSRRYWFDLDAIRETPATADRKGPRRSYAPGTASSMDGAEHRTMSGPFAGLPLNELGKNPGDVWEIATQPFPGAHFAVFPLALPERCILAGCKPGGTVLDPFSGSGTTGMAATKHGRKYIGIDLNAEYLDLSLRTRLLEPSLDFGGVS